jgi:hypothetical protein
MGAPFQFELTPNPLADQTGNSGRQHRVFAALMEVAEGS